MEITIPYYQDHTRVSNSNIGVFIKKGIKAFKKIFDGKEEQETKSYFEKGTMIHMFILQPEEFWDNYVILDFDTPKSEQQKTFAKELVNGLEFDHDKAVLSAYQKAYSTNNKTEDKMLAEGLELAQKLDNYINFLKAENNQKKVISWFDYSMLQKIKENISKHVKANTLINDVPDTTEQHNEFHINWEYPKVYEDYKLLCKSLIDRLLIDHETKTITLVDLKTSYDISNFSSHVIELDYTRQLAYYWLAIHWYFLNELNIEIADYSKETYIIPIQTTGDFDVSVIKFNWEQLEGSLSQLDIVIRNISWHFKNEKFDHCREYYENDGCIMFKVNGKEA